MRSLPLVLLHFSAGLTVVQSSCEVYCQSGTCILDDECASAGKTSTPNFCPNDPLWRTPNPEIPASNVQRHVLEAGETSLAAKEGAVHVVGCYADKNRGEWQGICEIVGTSSPSSPGVPEEATGPATCSANSYSHSP
ncbi:predicted protein [Histoplasma capsulatum H143]|uniref:Uncharacterized protein n=1 Tax=Ajellomyces capsulatus (strain H143) TaxID=544712 RepID=C6HE09_AJECH|nr:predicted protein [Histoplasma capsulatum H143]